jgi:7,8-dihydroneopterin aldolase/epimerase/oxygenase
MHTIALEGMEFFAYHGFLAQEREIGNRYLVDMLVETDFATAAINDTLQNTIDYSKLYQITASVMHKPSKLLEFLAQQIVSQSLLAFPNILSIEVNVAKQNPPIGGVCQWAKVSIKQHKQPNNTQLDTQVA